MQLLALLLAAQAWASAPLELSISDPNVIAVILECGGDTKRAMVRHGKASFMEVPKSACEVHYLRRSGQIDGPGRWTCGLDGCTQESVHHRAVQDAEGRVNVIVTSGAGPSSALEVTCPSGYRDRVPVEENTAIFEGVPNEACVLHFKGGAPGRYTNLRWGTWHCSLTGTTAVCTRK